MDLTTDKAGVTESGKEIPIGTKCRYLGHVVGGAAKVRMPDGSEEIVNPHIFKELRPTRHPGQEVES